MSKVRIYLEPNKVKKIIFLDDDTVVHKIKNVLRLKIGESLFVFDGEGREYQYSIVNVSKKNVVIEKARITKKEVIPQIKVSLAFPLMKETKLDFLLQKATELGAFEFIPFFSERSVILQKPSLHKFTRWRKIIIEAVRQSDRVWLPKLEELVAFDELVSRKYDIKMAAHPQGERLKEILDKTDYKFKDILLVIGPEGDFSPEEMIKLEKYSFNFVKLSHNILRTETAGIFFVGLVNYFIDTHRGRD